ncbi:MAG: 30S ribosomal protein S7, partial [Pseudomonadales bacterium]
MPRRRVPEKRQILPDPKYGNAVLAKFMNHVMVSGKKAVAESIVYGALDRIKERNGGDPIEVFDAALEAVAPSV